MKTIKIAGYDYSDIANCTDNKNTIDIIKNINAELSNENSEYKINYNGDDKNKHNDIHLIDQIEDRWGGIVGTIHASEYEYQGEKYDIFIKIRSRFDEKSGKSFFMAELIRNYIEEYYDVSFMDDEIPLEDEELYDFLKIFIFRQNLLAAYETGFYKKYTYFKNNDTKLRGRIDVSRHIKLNTGLDNGKIAYEYRENTIDNAVNHLIIRTWMELRHEFSGLSDTILSKEDKTGLSAEKILRQLQYLAPGFQKTSMGSVLRQSSIPVTSLYFSEYENLRKSCIDILSGLNLAIFTETEELNKNVQSMLFYVPDLWEVYVGRMLREMCKETGFMLDCQEEIAVLNRVDKNENKTIGKNRPDFVIKMKDEDVVKLVLDAKFKPRWSKYEDSYKWLESDIRQVLAYGELEQSEKIGVIFPIKKDDRPNADWGFVHEWRIGKRRDGVNFLVCGLKIPDMEGNDVKTWQKKLNENSKELKDALKDVL